MMFQKLCLLLGVLSVVTAFSPLPQSKIRTTTTTTTTTSQLHAKPPPQESSSMAESEYRELAAVFSEMNRSDIRSNTLDASLRTQIATYVRAVASTKPMLFPLKDVGKLLPGTQWKLIFSTETATMGDLPKDAQIQLEFSPDDDGNLDYVLEFSKKSFGLNRIVAKSTYTVDDTKLNPGLVTFVYDEIVTDVFGMTNLGIGFFGLLKGRANYVETIIMDLRFWMERGYTPEGVEFINVYLQQGVVLEDDPAPKSDNGAPLMPPIIPSDDQWA